MIWYNTSKALSWTRNGFNYIHCTYYELKKNRPRIRSFEEVVLDFKGNVRAQTQPETVLRDGFYDKHYANWNRMWHGKIHIVDIFSYGRNNKLSIPLFQNYTRLCISSGYMMFAPCTLNHKLTFRNLMPFCKQSS